MGRARWWLLMGVALASVAACDKVPLIDINARFALADATWFEEEQTLFVFYRVDADQGLGADTQVELTWRSDDAEQPWAPLSTLTPVHTHLAVDCGTKQICGSISLHVARVPTHVAVRMRYHRDGAVTLDAPVTFNVVGIGAPHTHRSLLVYGVFDERNLHVQWRARHQFPTLRNQEVQALGLRRLFLVEDPRHGDLAPPDGNPYGYGASAACPAGLTPLGFGPVQTTDRAVFDPTELPLSASTSASICAAATVTDALGTFTTAALARKNPEVRPAFPALRSPIRDNTAIGFVLRPCNRTISEPHLSMQVQRLLLEGAPEVCIDDWSDAGFVGRLVTRFRSSIDLVRPQGRDMVLVLALHHDDQSGQIAALLEQALAQVLPFERDKSSPRVSGAFVFDTRAHSIATPDLRRVVLWCPSNLVGDDLEQFPAASERSCPLMPDIPDLVVGPVKANVLPILPTRPQYLTFIDKYSDAQAGKMKKLTYRAPERTPVSENLLVGDFGVVTFFNNEVLTPAPTDTFSFCAPEDQLLNLVVFRSALVAEPLPLAALPEFHATLPQPSYALGLAWDFPYLLRLEYEVVVAGAATAYSFTVPFGVGSNAEAYYGSPQWETGEFPLAETLLQCTRFCTHPTFDSAGVYNVNAPFEPTYRAQCYRPRYPMPGEGGFPLDP